MKSPFPGMDPYLENHWLDVHNSLVFLAKNAVQQQLSDDLVARSEERLIVEDSGMRTRSQHADVRVVEHGRTGAATQPATGIAVAEPLIVEVTDDPIHQGFVEIIDAKSGGRVITVIEFLSPTNKKAGDGREKYKRKQEECIAAKVNLVEIDLTREGERALLISPWELPAEYRTPYLASVYRAVWQPLGRKEVYRIPLRERLPIIRIPLRAGDEDVLLDLQGHIDQAYAVGRYGRTIDYLQPCVPKLNAEDTAWAQALIESRKDN
jgi:hypothetical protein